MPTHSARANGAGSSDLTTERKRKSESRETTFGADVTDRAELVETVERLAAAVCGSLEEHGNSGRTVTMKIRIQPFKTYTRSKTIEAPTRDRATVTKIALELLERFDPQDPVRLVGVGVAGLIQGEAGPASAEPALTLDV